MSATNRARASRAAGGDHRGRTRHEQARRGHFPSTGCALATTVYGPLVITHIPNVLTIAGVDPSGGAGVLADVKTFSALGAYGTGVIAALTAQNTRSVTGIHGVPPDFVRLQLDTLFDDVQIDAVKIGMLGTTAATGGVAGVVYHGEYLSGSYVSGGRAADIVRHLDHIVRTVGPEVPALGSDWDGLIVPPSDMRTCLELPRLVQAMLDARFGPELIRGILGENFLRSLQRLRPGGV